MEGGLHISISPYHLGDLWGLPITPTLLSVWLGMAVRLVGAFVIGRSLKITPAKGQVAVELVLGGFYNYVRDTLEDEAAAKKYFPFIITIFIYIAAANLFSLLPFVSAIGITGGEHGFTPLFYPVNTDLN